MHYHAAAKKYEEHDWLLPVCFALILILCFLYIAETNAAMSATRAIPQKERLLFEEGQDLTKLEIVAAQLQSVRQVREVAEARRMTVQEGVTYVNINETPVAFTR